MNVSAITGSLNAQNATGTPQSVDYQAFLRLLVAQMKNQDPTAPMDSTDYVAQLATFSQVEQSVQINNKLTEMLQTSSMAQATGLIGKVVESMDGEISGLVRQVEIYSDGIVAVLDSGKKLAITPGVIIRDADYTPPPAETPGDEETGGEEAA